MSSVESNNALKIVLESYTGFLINWPNLRISTGQNFDTLIAKRSEDKISHEELMNQLMPVNQSVVMKRPKSCIRIYNKTKKRYKNNWVNQLKPKERARYQDLCRLDKDVNDRG